MKTGKDIDSIYRDRLKGAKMVPPQDAWENILSQLPQKEEKRRFFSLWMRFAGVAAILGLLFSVFNYNLNPSATEEISFRPAPLKEELVPVNSETFDEIMKEAEITLKALVLLSEGIKLNGEKLKAAGAAENYALEKEVSSELGKTATEAHASKDIVSTAVLTEAKVEDASLSEKISEARSNIPKDEPAARSSENQKDESRFRLSTRIAPVVFNSFGKGNAIENSFSQKDATGEVTFSYGLNVAFEVSEKLNIRSGFHKVDLAYSTRGISYNDVAATTSLNENLMKTTTLALPSKGTLNHKMGFFEIPVEVEYVLIDRKFAVGFIGGGSALFLEENSVFLNSPDSSTDLGETNSMNKFSFTTNIGLSLGYDVLKNLQLSMEPVFKLPLNTFKNGNSSAPYFFGIYSGLSYRF